MPSIVRRKGFFLQFDVVLVTMFSELRGCAFAQLLQRCETILLLGQLVHVEDIRSELCHRVWVPRSPTGRLILKFSKFEHGGLGFAVVDVLADAAHGRLATRRGHYHALQRSLQFPIAQCVTAFSIRVIVAQAVMVNNELPAWPEVNLDPLSIFAAG